MENPLANDIYASYRAKAAVQLEQNESVCWADVVSFMADGDVDELEENGSSDSCRHESKTNHDKQCWCGKYRNGEAV